VKKILRYVKSKTNFINANWLIFYAVWNLAIPNFFCVCAGLISVKIYTNLHY